MKTMLKIRYFFLALLAASFVWTGCEDDNEKDMEAPRLFRPTSFEASVSGVDVSLTWNTIPGAISYTVEVSLDSLDYSAPLFTNTTDEKVWLIENLQGGQTYYARIKANSGDSVDDSQYTEVVIEVPEENLFNNFTRYAGVVGPKTVAVAWLPLSEVTHLVFKNGEDEVEASLNEAELAAGRKSGIVLPENNLVYEVLLMNGANTRGKLDLNVRGDVFVNEGDDLNAAIEAAQAGNVIVLEGGKTFVHEGSWDVAAAKPLTFVGGPGEEKPVFSFNNVSGSTAINQPDAGVASLEFLNLHITGAPAGDLEAASSTWTPHFINRSGTGFIDELIFDDCIISRFGRNLMRFRSSSGMEKLVINNSSVDFAGGAGDYHVVVTENDSYITDIVFSNSTFYGSKRGLVRNNSNVPQNSFLMEYCTVNDMVDNGRYLIEMKSPIKTIAFNNCIFGRTIGQYNAESSSGGIYGASAIDGYTLTSSLTYALADFSQNLNESMADRMIDFPAYGKTAEEVFIDPDNYDFRVKDAAFGGRGISGDPRWW